MTTKEHKPTIENASFQAIATRLKAFGRLDSFGALHMGHWEYRVEDGGMTQVIVNTDIGIAYYHYWDGRIEGKFLRVEA